jgi:hypothetical protein
MTGSDAMAKLMGDRAQRPESRSRSRTSEPAAIPTSAPMTSAAATIAIPTR